MKLFDITLPMHEGMLTYEGDPPFKSIAKATVNPDDPESYNLSVIELSTHTGTHLDPPLHFAERGKGKSISDISLDILCGPARVADVQYAGQKITAETLQGLNLDGVERLLLKTINCGYLDQPFTPDYAHLTVDGAEFLRDKTKVRLVGIDYLSIETYPSPGFKVHRTLLEAVPPILILEGIDLRAVDAGDYELYCLPLRLKDGDGGPARVVLRRES